MDGILQRRACDDTELKPTLACKTLYSRQDIRRRHLNIRPRESQTSFTGANGAFLLVSVWSSVEES